jgi:two-component system chemotaxis response regulator CheB
MRKPIKVLVVDDAIVVRILVGNTISKDPDLEFVGKAENGKVRLKKLMNCTPM